MELKNKLLDIVVGLAIVLLVLVGYLGWCLLFSYSQKPKAATKRVNFEITVESRPSNWQEQLTKLIDTPHQVYWKDIQFKNMDGYTNPLTRKIYIDIDLSEDIEVLTYAHELTHLRYFTANETFVTYQAIIALYESGIPYFRYVALKNANSIINLGSYSGTRYDCGYLLQQYFEKVVEE